MGSTNISLRIDELATAQHAVVPREDLLAADIASNDIDRALARRQLVAVHPGIYRVTSRPLTWPGTAYADYRYLRRSLRRKHRDGLPLPVVALTGVAELVLRGVGGLVPPTVPLLITDPPSRSRRVFHRPRGHLATAPLEVVDGFVTTGLVWALAEASSVLPPVTLENTVSRLVRERRATLQELRHGALRLDPTIGLPLVDRLGHLTEADVRARSGKERTLYRAIVGAGLPAPLVNAVVQLAGRTYEVDQFWPSPYNLIIEVDGPEHDLAGQRRRDDGRDAAALAAGMRLERISVARIDTDLDDLVAWIGSILGGRA